MKKSPVMLAVAVMALLPITLAFAQDAAVQAKCSGSSGSNSSGQNSGGSTSPGQGSGSGGNKPLPTPVQTPGLSGLVGEVVSLQPSATGSTFVLQGGLKHSITVLTTSTTTITNQADKSAASLGNGLTVSVKGTYDSSTNEVTATSILVGSSVIGIVSNLQVESAGDTFTLTTANGDTLNIVMSATTTVKNWSNGSTATLSEGQQVQVTGKYGSSSLTFATTAIVINDKKPVAKNVGTVANLQTTTDGSTFTLQGARGGSVSVVTTATTSVINFSDNSAATLANGQTVCLSGSYDDTTKILTATSIVVKDNKPQSNKQSASGVIVSIDATAKTLVVTVKASNVQPTATTITIAVTSSTVYRTGKGKTFAFTDLTVGATVLAEGTFDATTQTLTATAICISK